ncbi:hypothetical protein PoB_005720900 [Plakobranchus ocellatus]|uniref:Uncharacterized protein n=1 Tax=Plakobranchus ocellatus TaxID=259542 RepID=A0AAV4CIQ1_9GAST|nr:hypothetical protein PoB_005720900 [Plakobranchus ocellatus]
MWPKKIMVISSKESAKVAYKLFFMTCTEVNSILRAFGSRHRDSRVFLAAAILTLESFWGRVTLAYYAGCWLAVVVARQTSSLQRFVINKGDSEKHELGRDQGKHCLVLFIRQEGRARPHIHTFASSHPPVRGNPRDLITFRLVFRFAISGNPMEC